MKESTSSARGGGGTASEQQPPPGSAGGNPQGNPDPENGLRKPWIQVHGAELDSNNDSTISSAEFDGETKRTFAGDGQNKDGKLSRDEYAGPGSVRSPISGFFEGASGQAGCWFRWGYYRGRDFEGGAQDVRQDGP